MDNAQTNRGERPCCLSWQFVVVMILRLLLCFLECLIMRREQVSRREEMLGQEDLSPMQCGQIRTKIQCVRGFKQAFGDFYVVIGGYPKQMGVICLVKEEIEAKPVLWIEPIGNILRPWHDMAGIQEPSFADPRDATLRCICAEHCLSEKRLADPAFHQPQCVLHGDVFLLGGRRWGFFVVQHLGDNAFTFRKKFPRIVVECLPNRFLQFGSVRRPQCLVALILDPSARNSQSSCSMRLGFVQESWHIP